MADEAKEFGAIKLQAVARQFLTRRRTLKMVYQRFEKIFDPKRKRFYYYDKAKDKSSWYKPVVLYTKDLADVAPTYTPEQAATKIQNMIRKHQALFKVRMRYQQTIMTVQDDHSGYSYYYNPTAGTTRWELPGFMMNRLDHRPRTPRKDIPGSKKAKKDSKKVKKSKKKKNNNNDDNNEDDDDEDDDDVDDKDDEDGENETKEGSLDEDEDEDDSEDGLSDDSEAVRERRRKKRKYPRSKVQGIVDFGQDHIKETFVLDLSNYQAKRFTSRIYDLTELTLLNLSHNRLRKIKEDIQYLNKLKYLDIRHNRINFIPKQIEELHGLTEFYAGHNQLEDFSGNFYKLKQLQRLDLSYNRFESLPLESGNLELLNDTGEWEVGIGMLQKLEYLDLRGNLLTEYPDQMEKLELLQELYLSENKWVEVPSELSNHAVLRILQLQQNQLQKVSPELYVLPALQELLLQDNQLTAFPYPTGFDPSTLSDSELSSKVAEGSHLKQLKLLNLASNRFVELTASFNVFFAVKTLHLAHNQLQHMSADCFSALKSLTYLDLSHNQLGDISSSLLSCQQLTYCDLSYNQLTVLPDALYRATKLKQLNLSYNQVSDMNARVVAMLYDLEKLEVQHNKIKVIPRVFYGCKKVTYLDFSFNEVEHLEDELDNWLALTYWDMSYNQVLALPESVGSCVKCEYLFLHHNAMKTLPTTLSKLTRLKKFTIHNNQLEFTLSILSILPHLCHANLSWNKKAYVHYSREKSKQSLQQDLTKFTIFGSDLQQYLDKNNTQVAPLKQLRHRLAELNDDIDAVVKKATADFDVHSLDIRAFRAAQPAAAKQKTNVDHLLRWLTKLRHHFMPPPSTEKENVSSHDVVQDSLVKLFPLRSQVSQQTTFHDLLIQLLQSRLQFTSHTKTKMFFSHLQFRQLRPLMYHPFFLDSIPTESIEESMQKEDPQELDEDVVNSLFLGFELLKPLEALCDILQDINILAMIEELSAWKQRWSKQAQDEADNKTGMSMKKGDAKSTKGKSTRSTAKSNKLPSFLSSKKLSSKLSQKQLEAEDEEDIEAAANAQLQQQAAHQAHTDHAILSELKQIPTFVMPKMSASNLGGVVNEEDEAMKESPAETADVTANYFTAFMQYLVPYLDVDLVDKTLPTLHPLNSSSLPIMTFPYLTLVRRDQEAIHRHKHDAFFGNQDDPYQDSLLSLFFEVNIMICKLLTNHVEWLSKGIRSLERVSQSEYSVLDKLCQRDFYYQVVEDPTTDKKKLKKEGDYEDLLRDIYEEINADQIAEEKRKREENKTVGATKRRMIKEYMDMFYAMGDLQDLGIEMSLNPAANSKEKGGSTEEDAVGQDDDLGSVASAGTNSSATLLPMSAEDHLCKVLGVDLQKDKDEQALALEDFEQELMVSALSESEIKERRSQYLKQLRDRSEQQLLQAKLKSRSWIKFLTEYRTLLLCWGMQGMENCMSILRSRGYDPQYNMWEVNHDMSWDLFDPRHGKGDAEDISTGLLPKLEVHLGVSPVVLQYLTQQARRCMLYRAKLYQYYPQYYDAAESFEAYVRLSQGRVPKEIYVSWMKLFLTQGNYKRAKNLAELIIRRFVMTLDPDAELPEAFELLAIDPEMCILLKFIEIQISALEKANVWSEENRRVYNIDDDGLRKFTELYPAPEVQRGRSLQEKQMRERIEINRLKQEEINKEDVERQTLIDNLNAVKGKLFKFLQDDLITGLKLDLPSLKKAQSEQQAGVTQH